LPQASTTTSYTNTGLTNGTAYYYKVAAVSTSRTATQWASLQHLTQPTSLEGRRQYDRQRGVHRRRCHAGGHKSSRHGWNIGRLCDRNKQGHGPHPALRRSTPTARITKVASMAQPMNNHSMPRRLEWSRIGNDVGNAGAGSNTIRIPPMPVPMRRSLDRITISDRAVRLRRRQCRGDLRQHAG